MRRLSLAVQVRHLALVVPRARGGAPRDRALDALKAGGGELDVERAERLPQALARAGADQRDDVVAARPHPRDRDLRDRHAGRVGNLAQRFDELEVAVEVLAGEPGGPGAEVA